MGLAETPLATAEGRPSAAAASALDLASAAALWRSRCARIGLAAPASAAEGPPLGLSVHVGLLALAPLAERRVSGSCPADAPSLRRLAVCTTAESGAQAPRWDSAEPSRSAPSAAVTGRGRCSAGAEAGPVAEVTGLRETAGRPRAPPDIAQRPWVPPSCAASNARLLQPSRRAVVGPQGLRGALAGRVRWGGGAPSARPMSLCSRLARSATPVRAPQRSGRVGEVAFDGNARALAVRARRLGVHSDESHAAAGRRAHSSRRALTGQPAAGSGAGSSATRRKELTAPARAGRRA